MNINAFFSTVPALHTWDNGLTWNTGGFFAEDLEKLYSFAKANLTEGASIFETGAGNSTICFLLLAPRRLVSIAPDAELFDRIRSYCDQAEISTNGLEPCVDGSEWVLPKLAQELRDQLPCFDFALIDG